MKAKVWVVSVLLSIYVGLYAYIARFTNPAGDDYVLNNSLKLTKSIIQTVVDYWFTKNSRFTSIFIISLGNSLGVMDNYFIHAPLAIAFNLFACYFAVTSLFSDIKTSSKILITLLFQSVWLAIAVELGQTLYWFTGVYYTLTCSVLIIEFALIVNIYKRNNTKIFLCLLGMLIFLNSGASELTASYQIPMFAGAVLLIAVAGDSKCSIYMFIMLLIAFAGLALHLTAPGNSMRITQLLPLLGPNPNPVTKDFFITYKVAVGAGLLTSFLFFTRPLIIYALLLFLPVISDSVKQPRFIEKLPFKFKIWHIILFEIITACCFQAIGGYSMGNSLYQRAVAPVRFIMLAQWILFFVFVYRNPKLVEWIRNIRIYKFKEIILLICLLLSSNFILLMRDYGIAPEYSRRIAERKEYIREQKALNNMDIIVPGIDISPRLLLKDTIPPKESPTNDYAYYYGMNSIRERDPLLTEALAKARDTEDEELNRFIAMIGGDGNVELFYKAIEGNEEARISMILLLATKGSEMARFTLARYCDTSDNLKSRYIQKNDAVALSLYFNLADEGVKDARELLWSFYTGGLRTERDFDIIKWGLMLMLSPF